ncbi:perforin-like protein 2 (PLP2) [Plasmodium ovale curtisi]|uniref:Perforin-like protein 2 (PLP2) n=1 Tax=Plasmodium ovale curtisi TaxID=864141 RepID=A0A1A8X102_PLAOA|nr:perforin-like protein 2 (PLP2) [Plasmodium ovale curtisi]
MKILVRVIFVHLLLTHFVTNNVKCEISGNIPNYQNVGTHNFEESNSSKFLNEEKSYITDFNSYSKNKRLKNNYTSLLNNPLYGYENRESIKLPPQNGKNKNVSISSNDAPNETKCNGTCSSFMLIKEHHAMSNVSKKKGRRNVCKMGNGEIVKGGCRNMWVQKATKDEADHTNDDSYGNCYDDRYADSYGDNNNGNGKRNGNDAHGGKNGNDSDTLNGVIGVWLEHPSRDPHEQMSRSHKVYVDSRPHDFKNFRSFEGYQNERSNQEKKGQRNEKHFTSYDSSVANTQKGAEVGGLDKEGQKLEFIISRNDGIGYSGKNYFEEEKFMQIKYPLASKYMEAKDTYVDGEKDSIDYHNSEEMIQYHSTMKPTKYVDIGDFIVKENMNKVDSNLGDSNLVNVIKDYKAENWYNFPKKQNKNLKEKKEKGIEKPYVDFDLRNTLNGNVNHLGEKYYEKKAYKEGHRTVAGNSISDETVTKEELHRSDIDLSLRYLGLGYDIIMGNPEGDPTLNVDPGFRGPVLQLSGGDISMGGGSGISDISDSNGGSGGISDSNGSSGRQRITPWVIPEHSCSQSKNVEEIRNLEQYKLELLSDVKVSTPSIFPYSFSASAEYKNALKKLKVQNSLIFLMKIYCLRYYTGIPATTTWKFTDNFKNALKKLPATFDGLKEESECTYEYYNNKMNTPQCEANVNKWMMFFKLHGTHIAHEIYLGGKIIIKMNMEKEEYNKMKENNISIKTFFNFYFHKMGLSSAFSKQTQKVLSKFRTSKNVAILGGNPGLNVENSTFFEKWVESINKNSMPIRTKLLPFSYFMEDSNMIQAYKDALTFYGLTYGVQIFDQEKYNHIILSIGEYLEKTTQKLYAGPPPGLLTCPIGSSLLMGFSINLDFYKNKELSNTNGMTSCEQMKESCSGNGFGKKYSDIRIWALCSEKPSDFITQVVQQGESPKITATCPGNLVILFGFALMKGKGASSANNIDIYPCRTGQNSCSAVLQNNKFKQSMIYIACVDKTTNGLENIQTFSKVKNMGQVNPKNYKTDGYLDFTCPKHSTLVFGFSLEFHTNFTKTRNNFTICSKESNTCEIKGIGINTNLSFFKTDKHSLGIVAVCRIQGTTMTHPSLPLGSVYRLAFENTDGFIRDSFELLFAYAASFKKNGNILGKIMNFQLNLPNKYHSTL